ncbi:MAG: hypothetical protein AVDCRST_MAG55-363, partial [uncultured Rubrobacteraceae bacterium]
AAASHPLPGADRHLGGSGIRGLGLRAADEPRAGGPVLPSVRLPHRGPARPGAPADARRVRRAPPPPGERVRRSAGLDRFPRGGRRAGRDPRLRRRLPRRGRAGPGRHLRSGNLRAARCAGAALRRDPQGGAPAGVGRLPGGRPRRVRLRGARNGSGRPGLDRAGLRPSLERAGGGRAILTGEM